jgi:FH1/FH2 domain-containing protein 3
VKDTVHKHSMLYHLTFWLLETIPSLSDLYSEIGPITRASKTDFEELSATLTRMEQECKNAWDYLKIINKFDVAATSGAASGGESGADTSARSGGSSNNNNNKMADFLTDAAERIIVMQKVNRIMRKNFQDFLAWLGIPRTQAAEYKVHHVCKVVSEFALEFRTSRERAQQTLKFKREAKERNRSRAKLNELVKISSRGDLNIVLGDGLELTRWAGEF